MTRKNISWRDIFNIEPEGYSDEDIDLIETKLDTLFGQNFYKTYAQLIHSVLQSRKPFKKIPIKFVKNSIFCRPSPEKTTQTIHKNGKQWDINIPEHIEFDPNIIEGRKFLSKAGTWENFNDDDNQLIRVLSHEFLHIAFSRFEENEIVEENNGLMREFGIAAGPKGERFGYFFLLENTDAYPEMAAVIHFVQNALVLYNNDTKTRKGEAFTPKELEILNDDYTELQKVLENDPNIAFRMPLLNKEQMNASFYIKPNEDNIETYRDIDGSEKIHIGQYFGNAHVPIKVF